MYVEWVVNPPFATLLQTSDLGLTENVGDSHFKFELWFRRRRLGGMFVLQAATPDQKGLWVQDISRLLWKQAIKNRGEALLGFLRIIHSRAI